MGASARFNLVSPIGRIVAGDPWKASDKDGDGQLRVYKSGPNVGQPNPQYYIGLAVPKLINGQPNADWASFYTFVEGVAKATWPNLFPGGGECVAQNFAWKITDGDGFVRQGRNAGKPLADKPGYKGCWIINFSSSFAPQCVVETAPGQYGEITDQNLLKRGYWVRIGSSVSGNDSVQTPGLYMNLEKIELKGIGEVIQTGISAAEAFGGAATNVVPEGMQALPAGHNASVASGFGPGPSGAAPAPPGPAFAPPAPTPTPAGPVMLPAANGVTYQAYKASGWSDEQLVAGGLMMASAPAPLAPPVAAPVVAPPPTGPMTPGPVSSFAGPAPSPMTYPTNPPPPNSGFMGVPVMLPAANGVTYDQYKASGWSDEQLVAGGLMAAR